MPPAITHRARAVGVARTISRRPSVSSDAHFETNVAPANPAAMKNSCTYSWRKPPADARSKSGKIVPKMLQQVGAAARSGPPSARRATRACAPMRPRPIPHARARGSWSPKARLIGPRTPRTAAGRPGSERPAVTPRSRRVNSSTPMARNDDRHDPHERQARPVVLADERDVVGRPAERAQGRDRADDVQAVGDPQDDHDETGDARRAGAAEERRQGERQPPKNRAMKPTQRAKPTDGQGRDRVAERGVAEQRRADRGGDGEDRHREAEHRQVGGQLLERDPALAERRGRDEVEAAAAGLAGQGRGQGEDRPERRAQGEDRPVLPGHVAAERAELLGLPEQVDHRRGHAPDELVHLEARRRRREDAGHGDAHDERHPAEQAGGDDEGEARVADRLAVDAAEAVQAAMERDRREGRRGGGAALRRSAAMAVPPRRPRGRTGRGTSPRGSARG